jgi:hypothetical protein
MQPSQRPPVNPTREFGVPQINVGDDTYARIKAFKPFGEELGGCEMSMDLCAETLILIAMQMISKALWGQQDGEALVQTLQKLTARHPDEVYGFLADVWKAIHEDERERLRQQIPFGFNQEK